MAPYQKPTVEEVEDEAGRRHKESGIRIQILGGTGTGQYSAAPIPTNTATTPSYDAARRLRKRKCAWEGVQRPFIPTVCR